MQKINEATPMDIPSQAEAPFEPRSIVGLHGAWSPESYFDEFAQAIANDGHAFYAPRYTIEDPRMNYSDQADEIAEKILSAGGIDHERIDILAHSRAGNLAPLLAARIAVRSITYVNAVIPGRHEDFEALVAVAETYPKHPADFENSYVTVDDITFFRPDAAEVAFFNDCTRAQKNKYKYLLRPNRVREDDIVLTERPSVPEFAIVCDIDQTIKAGWQKARCAIVLQRQPDVVFKNTGHTPFLSRPKEFAEAQLGLLAKV